ncbi:MAG: sugar ABC transporter ATP-binding protein [Clostridia bacterium]
MYTDEIVLETRRISKSFPGVKALQDVDLELHKGEVLALLGENGAGKSTLIKILSGDYTADQGEVFIEGKKVDKNDPKTAISLGVGVIYQELNNSDPLSIAENIYMGNLPLTRTHQVDYKKLARDTREMLDRVGLFDEQPFTMLGSLSIAKKQMVEIAKALSHNVKILVMDEPTASLNDEEIEILFGLVRRMSAEGTSIIYISHRLDEVFQLSDNIMVMRDGQRVARLVTKNTSKSELITHMVGRKITDMYPDRAGRHVGEVLLEVEDLQSTYIKGVSFSVHAGEIVGLFGLMGSGRTETVEMIIGDRKKKHGKIKLQGQEVQINSPEDAKKQGIGYLPSDRKAAGLFLIHSVSDNITLNVLDRIANRLGLVSANKGWHLSGEWIQKLRIKTPGAGVLAQTLSGGNQQKVVLAKWLAMGPKLLILNDPTRGIDVGAKTEIYNLMNDLSQQGLAIIMVSSELPEIMAMSDKIVILHEGIHKGTLDRDEFAQEKLLATAIGG